MNAVKGESPKVYLAQHWRAILNIVVILGLVGLAYAIRGQLITNFAELSHLHVGFLLLLIPLELLNYDAQARLYSMLYKVAGEKVGYRLCFKLSFEMNFINLVLPSGGLSGITYMGARMRGEGRSGSRAVLIQIMKLMMTFLSFELVLVIGLIVLAISGRAVGIVLLIAGALTTATFFGTVLFIFIITSQKRVAAFSRFSVRSLARLADWSHLEALKSVDVGRLQHVMEEMHENYKLIEKNYRQLQPAFWQAFFMSIWEVMGVFVVFLAFGHVVNIGAVILAYAVANLAGVISVLPGGAGMFEILMTGVLVIGGVPAGLALPGVIMYRIVSTIIQLPPGYYFYQHGIRAREA